MVFMNNYSDLESLYSLDSLEDETNTSGNTTINSDDNYFKTATIPFYTGEVPVEYIKTSSRINLENGSAPKSSKIPHEKLQAKLGKGPKRDAQNRVPSCIESDLPSKQQTSYKRISRRKELIEQNKNLLRARHRSVSYLEQFRKKLYGNNSLDSSSSSTACTKLPDREKNLSFISCLSGESRINKSEFEFYDELMSPTKESLAWGKGCLQSSTLITDEKSVNSAKSNKPSKQNKAKPIILSKIEVTIPDQEKPNLDKKRSIEKREMYANSVKLRNEMKINRQREREKKNKFNTSKVLSNSSFEDCLLQNEIKNACFPTSDGKTDVFHKLIQAENQEKCSKCARKDPANVLQKSKRRGMPQIKNKKNKTKSELLELQERHEREKSLIESMKDLMLKT